MKTITIITIWVLSSILNVATAQEFQGIATYKSKRKVDIKLDSTQANSEMHKKMMEMMKKQFEKTYILSFNKETSIYKEEESLSPPKPGGMEMIMINTNGSDILYKDIKAQTYSNQNDIFGKVFLIKDQLQKLEWTLSSETKNIGDYTCFKATTTKEIEVGESGISINNDKDLDDDAVTKKTVTITAWYTPQIAIANGPAMYQGLPGLILEINDGSESIMCSKIVINPTDEVEISEPTKGKVVSQSEFKIILDEKLKEMESRYNSDKGDGNTIEIKIKG